MTSTDNPNESDARVGPHGADDHGDGHGHDDHGHTDGERLGAVNLAAWGAGVVGILGGLIVALVLASAAGWFG